ncbi:PKD domain-containing protein [Longispora sp. NPDC051575]|uniref:PKD domain-containing protein n=1 Tax=Longispora sp. NPDC051575 TaxID=3154943 RepID=UPI003423E015
MRRTTTFGTIVVALTAGVSVASGPAHAATTELFVNNTVACSDAGTGSQAQPFCTLAAASAVVIAGQTVQVTGTYGERLTIARSGTPGNPIMFRSAGTWPNVNFFVLNGPNAGITIDGQHDVSVGGARITGEVAGAAVAVSASTRIALERVLASPSGKTSVPGVRLVGVTDSSLLKVGANGSVSPAISLDATTSRVTVTSSMVSAGSGHRGGIEVLGQHNSVLRAIVRGSAAGITVGPGATDTVVASNSVSINLGFGIVNDGATGTAIANNAVVDNCRTGIRVTGASAGVSVQNNDVRDNGRPDLPCAPGAVDRFGIAVYDAAVSGTIVDYNTVPPRAGVAPYAWGTFTGELAEFRTVSGQGAHDVAQAGYLVNIDSANSAAPGWQPTDRTGRSPVDSPDRGNTGAGPVLFADRGPTESVLGPTTMFSLTQRPGCQVTVDASATKPGWGAIVSYAFDFGDGATVTQAGPVATHTYAVCGPYPVRVTSTDANSMVSIGDSRQFRPGNPYVPVGPVRILDTREAIGTPGRTPVAAGGTLTLPVTGHSGVPAEGVTSVTMNVTATEPTSDGFLTIYPSGQPKPTSSNLNWTRGLTVPNLVVMEVVDGKVNFHNSGPGTVHLVADLVGYHTTGMGSSFVPLGPVRALDTREAIGTTGRTPVAPGGTLTLPVAGRTGIPATGVTAVTMNVTVTEPTSAGFLTVYPNGRALPNASNLNWTAGQTVPNLVVVPVVDGKVNLRNSGPGTVHVIADVVGYHTTDQGTLFQPRTPYRALDTRNGTGIPNGASYPVTGGWEVSLKFWDLVAEGATSVVLNVTVTEPTADGFLTVYGDFGQPLPNASNLNWRPGQTVPNLVVVPLNTANATALFHNTGAGTVHVVADVVGFYRN